VPLQSAWFIACPHCLEQFEVCVDLTAGSQRYVEDCEVCCHPILLTVTLEDGAVVNIEAERENA